MGITGGAPGLGERELLRDFHSRLVPARIGAGRLFPAEDVG